MGKEMDDVEKVFNLSRLDKNKKDELEKALESEELNEDKKLVLINTCYLYSNMKFKPEDNFYIEKYGTYQISELIKRVKEGKTPLKIMTDILNECDKYSIVKKNMSNQAN
jgi:hypothetical protein